MKIGGGFFVVMGRESAYFLVGQESKQRTEDVGLLRDDTFYVIVSAHVTCGGPYFLVSPRK